MRMKRLLLLIGFLAAPLVADANGRVVEAILNKLQWRNIGPAIMGGRIDDFAVVESDPRIIYAAAASGGLFRTTNNGVTWEPLFDQQPVSTIGDVAVAPSDPSIVFVGTGEPNNRQSSSWGNGVYKSTDGGKTWTHLGLRDTHHIGRVLIHPRNPDVVYVAAVGHLWGPNKERGLYKTTDGGKTWTNTKFINEDTGFIDAAMDPESPDTLFAAAYQRRRAAFGFNGGGPGSGLYKTTDAGASWTRLTQGLPEGDTGRIGIDIYRKNPRILYVVIENAGGGVFRSEDKGASWTRMSETNPRPMYYSQIRIDPQNDQRIWVLGAPMYHSEEGGRNFRTDVVSQIHGDHHALWINPASSDHLVLGSDGGIHFSYDRGRTWDYVNTLALGQFYEIGFDMDKPYRIYGGLQDNGSWGGPVRTPYRQGITNEDWMRVGGGDGFYAQVDWSDPTTVYTESQDGNLGRLNLKTLERKNIKPEPKEGERPYRFDWNSPILVSSHNPQTIYFGGNRLFKSTNRGDSWTASPDLTKNLDRDEMPIMGVVPNEKTLSRHDGISTYGQIVTLSESPLKEGLLYVGTDDGNLQVSRDGGENWKNVAEKTTFVPKGTYVSRVVASRHAEGRVYATFDGHRNDDYGVHAAVSEDYGESWKSIAANLPAGHTLSVIREHPRRESLLFAGGEFGAFVSLDRGKEWHRLGGKLPTVPVDDIAIHPRENDLILGTHGRSIYVLDDLTPLETLSDAVLDAELHLFDVRPATSYRIYNHKGNTGHKMFIAPNPPEGALIHYTLKSAAKEDVKITVLDREGRTIREWIGPREAGLNRTNWDLRYPPPVPQVGGGGGFFGPPPGPRVLPGEYRVKIAAGGREATTAVKVEDDPRIQISEADRRAQLDALLLLGRLLTAVDNGQKTAYVLKNQLSSLQDSLKKVPSVPEAVTAATKSLTEKVDQLEGKLSRTGGRQTPLGAAGPPPRGTPTPLYVRLNRLYGGLESYSEAPSQEQLERIEGLSREARGLVAQLNTVIDEEVPSLNRLMNQNSVPQLQPGKRVEVPGSP